MQQPAAVSRLLLAASRTWQPALCGAAGTQQLQPGAARGMAVVVDVSRNNVDKAYVQLNKHFKEAGMVDELRKREYRKTSAELKFNQHRATFNKRMGALISERLKWVVRRRKLKI